MWFTKRHETDDTCGHTLVVHADGTAECEGERACGTDEALHEWWVACHELGCGCVGEEHDLVLAHAA